jgi:hypothetical protein
MNELWKCYWRVLVIVVILAYASIVLFVGWAMRQEPEKFGRVMSRMPTATFLLVPFETMWKHARVGTLHTGDAAPDFRLPTVDHQSTVQLSSLRGSQPVVLVFGSFT